MALPVGFLAVAGQGVSLVVPRTTLGPLLKDPNRQHGRVLRRETPLGAILAQHMIAIYLEASRFRLAEPPPMAHEPFSLMAFCPAFALQSPLWGPCRTREHRPPGTGTSTAHGTAVQRGRGGLAE